MSLRQPLHPDPALRGQGVGGGALGRQQAGHLEGQPRGAGGEGGRGGRQQAANLVGRGEVTMVSTTRVTMTGLPSMLHCWMTCFWTRAIFSGRTSRPRLPRLSMTASASCAMALKLNRDCRVSHLAINCTPTFLKCAAVSMLCCPDQSQHSWACQYQAVSGILWKSVLYICWHWTCEGGTSFLEDGRPPTHSSVHQQQLVITTYMQC